MMMLTAHFVHTTEKNPAVGECVFFCFCFCSLPRLSNGRNATIPDYLKSVELCETRNEIFQTERKKRIPYSHASAASKISVTI